MKVLEENIDENLHDLEMDKDLFKWVMKRKKS